MMKTSTTLRATITILCTGLAVGCGGKKKDGDPAATPASGSAASGAAPASAPAESGPWAGWGMDARARAWQGAWAGDGGAVGQKAAWAVDGTTISYVDSGGAKTLALDVTSPCSVMFTEKSADGSSSGTGHTYTLQDGQLVTGLGDAGSRKGKKAIVCGFGGVYALDDKACTLWTNDFGSWKSEPGECGIRTDAGKEVFYYKDHGHETTVGIDGDVIWDDQIKGTHAAKQPDLAAAKKAQGL